MFLINELRKEYLLLGYNYEDASDLARLEYKIKRRFYLKYKNIIFKNKKYTAPYWLKYPVYGYL